ncbi:MAG: potassium transporter Trk, partial [Leptospiraceae bacterium]|nr:potassium transporter Trk [Leptospiraceae bacterium]
MVGAILIYLSEHELSIFDSLYLSASAFCVTGLSPIDISTLEIRTQILILAFIQIGGIGIILFTVLIGLMVIRGLSRNAKIQELVKGVLDAEIKDKRGKVIGDSEKIGRIIFSIFKITLGIELSGAIVLYFTLGTSLEESHNKVLVSLFTSVSAFNNAGFSIIDNEKYLTNNPATLYTLTVLIVLGGIGYPVIIFIEKSILEAFHKITSYFEIYGETYLMRKAIIGEEPSKLYYIFTHISAWSEYRIEEYNKRLLGESNIIQTKIIFYGTLILLLGGAILLFLLEYDNEKTIGKLELPAKVANILFLSASSRTAGFNTFQTDHLYDASIVLVCILMFIGG